MNLTTKIKEKISTQNLKNQKTVRLYFSDKIVDENLENIMNKLTHDREETNKNIKEQK